MLASHKPVTLFIVAVRTAGNNRDVVEKLSAAVDAGLAGDPVNLRRWLCTTLSLVKLHRAGCERCSKFESCWGNDIRRRLQELQAFDRQRSESAVPPAKSVNDDAA